MYGKAALQLGCKRDGGEGRGKEEKLPCLGMMKGYLTGRNAPSNDLSYQYLKISGIPNTPGLVVQKLSVL